MSDIQLSILEVGPAGASECGQNGVLELEAFGPLEKFGVFGVGAGPAFLDLVGAQLVQPIGDDQLVLNGQRYALVLCAVAKRCVVYLYLCHFSFLFTRLVL